MTQVCMIALDDFTLENGCPEVAPETWKKKEGWLSQGARGAPGLSYPPEEELGPWVAVQLKVNATAGSSPLLAGLRSPRR